MKYLKNSKILSCETSTRMELVYLFNYFHNQKLSRKAKILLYSFGVFFIVVKFYLASILTQKTKKSRFGFWV
jgi:hypothetical protein